MIKPVVQEVDEVIQPFRVFRQRIQPVVQHFNTVVSEAAHQTNQDWDLTSNMDTGAQHSFNNDFDNGFEPKFATNERQNFESRPVGNQIEPNHNSGDEQKPEQQFESDFSESNRRTTYRILPIIIRRTDQSIDSWNQLPDESEIHQKIKEIIKFLNI